MTFATLGLIAVMWGGYVAVQMAEIRGGDLHFIDLLVYRAGGHAVLEQMSMYSPDFAEANQSPNGLPFTYPPFSGLVFAPFALLPAGVAKAVMLLSNAAATAVFFTLVAVGVGGSWDRLRSWHAFTAPISVRMGAVLVTSAAIFIVSTPVRENFNHGQVNMILAALVALDVLLPKTPWPRGTLVGLAVAVKLTPAVFVGYFFVTRRWRAMAVSLAAAAAAFALAWIVMPADTSRYFKAVVMDTERIGGLAFASNQSIRGVLERIPAADSAGGVLWLIGVVVVLALAIVAIRNSTAMGDPVAALLAAAFIGLLCSPVSWGHHWVWLSAAAVYFLVRWAGSGGTGNLVAGLVVAALTVYAPWAHLPSRDDRERLWSPLEHVLGSSWAIVAFVLLIVFATSRARRAPIG